MAGCEEGWVRTGSPFEGDAGASGWTHSAIPVLVGVGIGFLFWTVDSAFDAFIFHEGTWVDRLVHVSGAELAMRFMVILGSVAFTVVYARACRTQGKLQRRQLELGFVKFMVDKTADSVLLLDPDAHFLYVNEASTRLLGYSRDELLRMSLPDIDPMFALEVWRTKLWEDLRREKQLRFETRHQMKSGEWVSVEVTANHVVYRDMEYACSFVRDISVRKAVEDELKRSQESLARAQAIGLIGNWERDLTTNQVYWSSEMRRLVDLVPTDPIHDYQNFLALVHPEDRELVKKAASDAVREGKRYSFDYRLLRKDGKTIFVHANAVVIRDQQGRPVRLAGTAQDVTEQKLAERAIRASEERVRLLLASTADGIFGVDLEGICIFANCSFTAMLGYTAPQELLGRDLHALMHHTKADGLPYPPSECPGLRALAKNTSVQVEDDTYWKADGTSIRVEYGVRPIVQDGKTIGTVTSVRDITEERKDEERRALLAEAGAVLGSSLDYSATLKAVTRLTVPRFADVCATHLIREDGRTSLVEVASTDPAREQALRKLVERYPPDMHDWRQSPFVKALQTRLPVLISKLSLESYAQVSRDAEHLQLISELGTRSWMVIPMIARTRVLGFLSLTRMTDRYYDQKDLAAGEELARRAATAVDNALLYQSANEAIQTRDDFLSVASHELKTPLTSLHLQLQLVQRLLTSLVGQGAVPGMTQEELKDRILNLVGGSGKQIVSLAKLINNLLDVTRVRAGRIEISLEELNLAVETKDTVSALSPEITQSRSSVALDLTDGVIGQWDRIRIRQIITNLLSNAIKYGEGKPIRIRIARDTRVAYLEVQDQGKGIPQEHQSRIFERFERAVSSRSISGLGLGLYITRQLVEAHRGSIRVDSEPGQGAKFTVALPLQAAPGSQGPTVRERA